MFERDATGKSASHAETLKTIISRPSAVVCAKKATKAVPRPDTKVVNPVGVEAALPAFKSASTTSSLLETIQRHGSQL